MLMHDADAADPYMSGKIWSASYYFGVINSMMRASYYFGCVVLLGAGLDAVKSTAHDNLVSRAHGQTHFWRGVCSGDPALQNRRVDVGLSVQGRLQGTPFNAG